MGLDILKQSAPLTRIVVILIFIMVLPAFFFSAYQYSTLGEYEEMLEAVYSRQLETILFSVNQYAWDFVGSWTNKIKQSLNQTETQSRLDILSRLQETNPTIAYIIISDTLVQAPEIYPQLSNFGGVRDVLDTLRNNYALIQSLLKISRRGYQRIQSIMVSDSHSVMDNKLMLLYIQPAEKKGDDLVTIVINPQMFVTEVLAPKLEQIAGNQFSVGVYNVKTNHILFSNSEFSIDNVSQQKKLWLFPDFSLGIYLAGETVETLASSRFTNSLILIGLLDVLLIIGGVFLVYNLRKEMQLAKLKSDFVSNVSHELRTPLALIRMYAETLEMGRVKSDLKRNEYYSIINQESERLTRLINNILNFSRIESGRKEYKFKPVDLNRIIRQVIDIYQYHIEKEGFILHTELSNSLPRISADEEAISESIINLLDNAIKYSRDMKEIIIRSGRSNNEIYFEIEDKGIGIETKYHTAVFDKFYRISSGLVHDTKGSGLGLALVKHIMHSHGGRIELKSIINKGSLFKLIFPMKNENNELQNK